MSLAQHGTQRTGDDRTLRLDLEHNREVAPAQLDVPRQAVPEAYKLGVLLLYGLFQT